MTPRGSVAADLSTLPYRIRDGVLSPGELAFDPIVRESIRLLCVQWQTPAGKVPMIFAGVRWANVLVVDGSRAAAASAWQRPFNAISSKEVDFVIGDAATTRPLLVIELDDQSHRQPSRIARDTDVDRMCASAGLPVLHVAAAARYDPRQLAERIAAVRARPDDGG